jgi:hypothetical protein
MEKIKRHVKTNQRGTIFSRTGQCREHADDVVVLGHATKHITKTIEL